MALAFVKGVLPTLLPGPNRLSSSTSGLHANGAGARGRYAVSCTLRSARLGVRLLAAAAEPGQTQPVPDDGIRLSRGAADGAGVTAGSGSSFDKATGGDAAVERAKRLQQIQEARRQLNSDRLEALRGMKDADEEIRSYYKDFLTEVEQQIQSLREQAQELSAPRVISLRQLMEKMGCCRLDGSPPVPGSIFRGAPVAFPEVRFPRSRVLAAIFLRIRRQLKDVRLVSFLSASSGAGKTQVLADVWSALLQTRLGTPPVPGEPFFELDWDLYNKLELRQLASSMEVFGITFNNSTEFCDREAKACQLGGEYLYLPLYSRIIWGEHQNGEVSWEKFLLTMHQRLEIAEVAADGPAVRERLDVHAIAAEAREILDGRRATPGACGLLLVDELSRVCSFDDRYPLHEDKRLLSGALRSKTCALRETGTKQKPFFILFSSLSMLFMEAENSATLVETTSGRTLVCASALTRPPTPDVRAFFQQLRTVPGLAVSSASPTSAPLDLDALIEGVSFLSGGHPRSMQTILTELSQPNVRYKLVWNLLDVALRTMSTSSSFKEIEDTLVKSPLVCAVALLGHPVEGSRLVPGSDGAVLTVRGKPQRFDDLVATTTLVDSATQFGMFVEPAIVPSFLINAIGTHAAARSVQTKAYLARRELDVTAELEPDSNPVLTSLANISQLFASGTAAKGFEIFHRTWEVSSSLSRACISQSMPAVDADAPNTFTLRERYPATQGVCGSGSLLSTALDKNRVLLGSRSFTTMAELLAYTPDELVQYLWMPTSSNFPSLDAVVFHARAGADVGGELSDHDVYMTAIQCKTKEPTTDDKGVDLNAKFVEPFRRLCKAFNNDELWAVWKPRVAYVAVVNLPVSVAQPKETQAGQTRPEQVKTLTPVLDRKVRAVRGSAAPRTSQGGCDGADDGKITLREFLDGEGKNTILVARETMDQMYGSLFSDLLWPAIALVGAHLSTT